MSYISIVGGKIIETTGGEYNIYAKEDIVTTSEQSVTETGAEEGVSFDKDPKKGPVFENNRNSINVNLNIFFDGTSNNKTNTESRVTKNKDYQAKGNKNDDSYENDYTNIARGFDAVDPSKTNQVRVYVEGIGTEDSKTDSVALGVALGEGNTGVEAKVTKGCWDAAEQMSKLGHSGKNIDILYVNVYGFSRGAAAARHFIYVASKKATYEDLGKADEKNQKYFVFPHYNSMGDSKYNLNIQDKNTTFIDTYGYFGACMLSKKMKIKEIRFNFVGIYDTVASMGVYHGNDVEELHLKSITKANFVFHIASDDEYRENFDLTNIESAGVRGFQLLFPGVHSDIGGSYLNGVEEISVIDNLACDDREYKKREAQKSKDKEYDKFKKIVVDEGWYKDDGKQLVKQFFYERDFDKISFFNRNQHNYGLVGRRILSNSFDKIPLKFMTDQSKHFEVVYADRFVKNNEIKDPFISSVYANLMQYYSACAEVRDKYVKEFNNNNRQNFTQLSKSFCSELKQRHYSSYITPEDLKKLRNEYLHWSVKANLVGYDPRGGKEGALVQEQRKREIHNG